MIKRLKAKEIKYTEKGFMRQLGLDSLNGLSVKGVRINGRYLTCLEDIEQITVIYNVLVDENDFEIRN